jgi:hypothetical protein
MEITNISNTELESVLRTKVFIENKIMRMATYLHEFNKNNEMGITTGTEITQNYDGPLELVPWQSDFFDTMSMSDRFTFMSCSYYLGITAPLHCMAQYIANIIKGKSPEEIRATFLIPEDLSQEERNLSLYIEKICKGIDQTMLTLKLC